MKKKVLSLLLAAVMVTGLTACGTNEGGGNSKSDSGNETSQESEDAGDSEDTGDSEDAGDGEDAGDSEAAGSNYEGVELTYWSMWANTEPQGKVIQAAVDKFQEETGAKVTIEWKNRDVKDILNSALESKKKSTCSRTIIRELLRTM